MKTEEKALRFMTALLDVYRGEDNRELYVFDKLDLDPEDATDDFTAMLLAMQAVYKRLTGDAESDLVDFTHILNKLAVQSIMGEVGDGGEK